MTSKDKVIGVALILIGIAFIALGVYVEMITTTPNNNQVYSEQNNTNSTQQNELNVYTEQNNTNNNVEQTDEESSTRYIY